MGGATKRTLDEMARLRAENRRLETFLAEVDGLLEEYPTDTVGTGSQLPARKRARVDAILERSVARQRERVLKKNGLTGEPKNDGT